MAPLINEAQQKLPGMLDVMEPDGSMMHTTATVDIVTVLSGRIVIELDDGASKELRRVMSLSRMGRGMRGEIHLMKMWYFTPSQ